MEKREKVIGDCRVVMEASGRSTSSMAICEELRYNFDGGREWQIGSWPFMKKEII